MSGATPADPQVSGSKNPNPSNASLPTQDPDNPAVSSGDNTPTVFPAAGYGGTPDPDQPVTSSGSNTPDWGGESGPTGVDMTGSIYAQVAPLAAPVVGGSPTITHTDSGVFGATGSYKYVVTTLTAEGESTRSNEVSAAVSASTDSVTVSWAAVTGATGYKVYRGTSAGAENKLVATLGLVLTYKDHGAAGTTATVPSVNGAKLPLSDPNHNAGDGGAAGDGFSSDNPVPAHDPETPAVSGGSNTPHWGGEGSPSSVA